jgi:hypothetical protein
MRLLRLAAAVATASMLAATPAFAGFYEDVAVARGFPPIGYVFDPVDPGSPVFIANQGPVLAGPGVYAPHEIGMPTHPGYAVVTPFPYVRHVPDVRVFSRPYGIAPYAISVYWPEPRARFRHARIRHAR